MDIVFHLGAHLTDRDHLVRCLLRNRQTLAEQGIAVPSPGDYRQSLRQLAYEMSAQPTSVETQEALLDGLVDIDGARRVVFSAEGFLSTMQWAVANNQFYPAAAERLQWLAHLFPASRITVAMGLRDPATYVPALYAQLVGSGTHKELLNCDPLELRWSSMVARVRKSVPDARFILWRDEDVPLIWPEVLRAVADHDPKTELEGWFAWYWELMTPKTHEAMRRYFAKNPVVDDLHRRKILAAMLDKFVREDAIPVDPLPPDWSEDLQDTLSDLYEADCDALAAMPSVRFLEP